MHTGPQLGSLTSGPPTVISRDCAVSGPGFPATVSDGVCSSLWDSVRVSSTEKLSPVPVLSSVLTSRVPCLPEDTPDLAVITLQFV